MAIRFDKVKMELGSMFISKRISNKVLRAIKAQGISFDRRKDVEFMDERAAHVVFATFSDLKKALVIEDGIERIDMELSAHAQYC